MAVTLPSVWAGAPRVVDEAMSIATTRAANTPQNFLAPFAFNDLPPYISPCLVADVTDWLDFLFYSTDAIPSGLTRAINAVQCLSESA